MKFFIFEKLSELRQARSRAKRELSEQDAGGDLPLEQIERRFSKIKN